MLVNGKNYQSIWIDETDRSVVRIIDQQRLPFIFTTKELRTVEDVYSAISDMSVRGAPAIGAAGAFGMYLATLEITSHTNIVDHLRNAAEYLISCRPTAVNLRWAVSLVRNRLTGVTVVSSLREKALSAALEICETEKENCRQIGISGIELIREISKVRNGKPVNILTHCNAGWLACVDYGTVTAPIYLAKEEGIPVHVWVDETRPLNQGARLTAWELGMNGVPHTLIVDNAGGHLMQKGMVDMVLVGSDRVTRSGDVANKTGTYLKALAARDNGIPFYAALPTSTIDMGIADGLNEIVVEERDPEEVTMVSGFMEGEPAKVRICPANTPASNYGFDITPARLVTGLITEMGICRAEEKEIVKLFPDIHE
ncbi:MAG: S-methyl-5-thioribose-1-phosphate isomerase [Bacteroidales bacterium]|jgi:methylthioribose-1-phosphate isomerase|nr:S-methyl-5-thioribose-1-phosphate isomerase [Bacteroidales bacterium]